MYVQGIKNGHLQMFSGADADQRFTRDDAGDDMILRERERDLHSQVAKPMRVAQDEPADPLPPADDDADDKEYGRDSRGDIQRHALGLGF